VHYKEIVAGLGPLETFEARAFVKDVQCPQKVCDLVLGLALIHTDLRDVVLAQTLLDNVSPRDQVTPTVELGHFNGLAGHLVRLQAGILHELLEVVKDHGSAIRTSPFPSLVAQLTVDGRAAWDAIIAAARGKRVTDPLGRLLFFARNKVAFHYDLKALHQGYARSFPGGGSRVPYISLGANMARTRFYFAEAAADTYMRDGDADAVDAFFSGKSELLVQVNKALSELVVRFVASRNAGWSVQRHHR
jgi:hypothetical protein